MTARLMAAAVAAQRVPVLMVCPFSIHKSYAVGAPPE
jgi:hypothetical protein